MGERRCAIRAQTQILATVATGALHEPCAITNLSDNGAKICVRPHLRLSGTVLLRAPEIGLHKTGWVVWQA